jgi:hypothetical protein
MDKRYSTVLKRIRAGKIQSFLEIFNSIPRCVVSQDMKRDYEEFCNYVVDPYRLTAMEILLMSYLFKLEPGHLIMLMEAHVNGKLSKPDLKTYAPNKRRWLVALRSAWVLL